MGTPVLVSAVTPPSRSTSGGLCPAFTYRSRPVAGL